MTTRRSLWAYMRWSGPYRRKRTLLTRILDSFPISFVHQALFAEAFSQALISGMDIPSAIESAAITCRSGHFRRAMSDMASYCRTGDSLTNALSKCGVRTSKLFRASLSVGENRGHLAEELAAFACDGIPDIADRLARSVGRSPEVSRFVRVLSRLLSDHRLTTDILRDAAVAAGGKGSKFEFTIVKLIEDMKDGESFVHSLERQSPTFDPFLCGLMAASSGRDGLRRTLGRISGDTAAREHSHSTL